MNEVVGDVTEVDRNVSDRETHRTEELGPSVPRDVSVTGQDPDHGVRVQERGLDVGGPSHHD